MGQASERSASLCRLRCMETESLHAVIRQIAQFIEIAGVAIILIGIVVAAVAYFRDARACGNWRDAYARLRSNLGRAILLGLELLVAADIIATITAPLSAENILLLGAVVLIRTFLSFALETEIEGTWPWRRAAMQDRAGTKDDER